jgi:hypothetical protein
MSEDHVSELWTAARDAADSWEYLRYGPFPAESELRNCIKELSTRPDQPFWMLALSQETGRRDGSRYATYIRPMAP